MSASPVFSSAAIGRPFIFPARSSGALLAQLDALPRFTTAITPASRLHIRPAPEMVSSGIPELDALTGGFPRGCLTEICGTASSGRTSILLSALAHATRNGEVCALVDSNDALNPASAAAAGVEMERLLWVRCRKAVANNRFPVLGAFPQHNFPNSNRLELNERRGWESSLEQVLKVTDLLLQSNGFGMIVLDLADIPVRSARRIPLASWFRFRRAIEHTPTVLLILEQQPIAGSCASVLVKVRGHRSEVQGKKKKLSALSSQLLANQSAHAELFDEFEITAELLRTRLDRKLPQSVVNFPTRATWAS
jgi:recA bacterial DNA recombination protein